MHFSQGQLQVSDIAQGEACSDAVEGVGGEGQSQAVGQEELNATRPRSPSRFGPGDGQHLGRDVYSYYLLSARCQEEG
jgi:hypothetical protein